ncbi:MAG: DICT sensory domain-containing protein, partial [Mycobacterium sp.]|nr:DICT sensory domain-containing protein [Mycobacterium sp.]
TFAGVLAHQERTGTVILAEGVETDEHLERALAVGATLGQGFRFGAAAPLPSGSPVPWSLPAVPGREQPIAASPFEVVRARSPVRTTRRSTVIALSHHVESLARPAFDPPILLTALQHRRHFSETRWNRYRRLAERSVLVAVFGETLPRGLGPGIRGVNLNSTDPLCHEWTIIALGPHTSAAVIAREHAGPAATKGEEQFDMVLTYDRELVTAAARALMYRIP